MNFTPADPDWAKSPSACAPCVPHTGTVFDSLFERSGDAIWVLEVQDPRTVRLVDCNQAAVRLVGAADKAQVLRTRLLDFSAPVQLDGSAPRDTAAPFIARMEKQYSHRFEWMLRRLDGQEVPIEVSATAATLEERTCYVVISRDISERKQAEAELRDLNQTLEKRVAARTAELSASEARFRAMVEHAPEAIVVYNADTGRFLFGNQHACDLYGVPMSRLAELTPADVSPEFQACGRRSSDLAREKVLEVLAGGRAVFEWLHRQPNGRLIPTEVRLFRLPAEGQNLIRASIMDNTERKRAEEELLKTLQREKGLSQLKTNFVSMVSHEFRTPLGIIQSSGELLRDFYPQMNTAEREEQLESIIRNTRRMAGMMEEILVLSRLDAGKLDFRPCPLDFASFCRRVVDEMLSATQHCCPIELTVAGELPPAHADERLLGHIFTNLLSNAVKYSATQAAVQFRVVRRGAEAVCVIRDQGIGIPAADQGRLFTAFHRGENVGTRSGTGLGLVLVKRCVELHQGRVQIQSAPERGTTVTTCLPCFPYEKNPHHRRRTRDAP